MFDTDSRRSNGTVDTQCCPFGLPGGSHAGTRIRDESCHLKGICSVLFNDLG